MPRRKITVEEAFAALEQAGIQVQVKAVSNEAIGQEQFEAPVVEEAKPALQHRFGTTTVRLELHAQHSISAGGVLVGKKGEQQVVDGTVVTYGPGVCWVPAQYAQHLAYQDMVARQADDRLLDRAMRSYVVAYVRDSTGVKNIGLPVSRDQQFDLSGFLGQISTPGSQFSSIIQVLRGNGT